MELISAAVMAVGLFFVFLKIGRKLRFWKVLLRPQTSWMTRETYCAAAFYLSVAAAWWGGHPVFDAIAAAAAVGFLICQAFILHASVGIPSWRAPLIPWMLIATGLFEGGGALSVVAALLNMANAVAALSASGIILAAVNAALWLRYRATARKNGIGAGARRELGAISPALHVLGHGAPLILFALALILPAAWAGFAVALAGAGALAGGLLWKFTVITRACHQQGFALPYLPQRGSGTRASPARYGLARSA